MEREERSGTKVTTTSTEASPLEEVVEWISGMEGAQISILTLFREGPEHMGVSEVDLRELVIAGIEQRRLALAGLADVIRVRKDAAE